MHRFNNPVAPIKPAAPPLFLRPLLCGFVLALTACQTPLPPPVREARPAPTVVAAPAPAVSVESREIRIRGLLDQANRAIRYDHLTGPHPGSAEDLFRQVLALDPNNEEALRGPEKIAERLVAKALEAASRWSLTEARAFLARARAIMPGHPSIAPTETQINLLGSAKRKQQRFDAAAVQQMDERAEAASRLAALGAEAKGGSCRTTITAPSDETGRWMFQKMNEVDMDGRVRANIRIGSPPGVELVCFPGQP